MTRYWLLLLLLLPAALSAGITEDFEHGISLYDQGDFDAAAMAWQDIVDQGYVSAELYYNLGCAYFKAGELGYAIVNFRRAERLAPDDEDIKINSQFAQLFMVDKIEAVPGSFFPDQVLSFLSKLHPNQYFWISLAAFALLFVVLSLKRFGWARRWGNATATIFLIVTILSAASMIWVLDSNYLIEEGVIVVSETEVQSGPGVDFELQFTGHEGLTFKILDSRNDYYLGLFANKLKGWIKKSAVVRI
ncbi:MAG: tetratricopeptide repeat protein [bacterium]